MAGIRSYKNVKKMTADGNEITENEFMMNKNFPTVRDSLKYFWDDPLLHEPGTKYFYTSLGYSVLSAICEVASGENYLKALK